MDDAATAEQDGGFMKHVLTTYDYTPEDLLSMYYAILRDQGRHAEGSSTGIGSYTQWKTLRLEKHSWFNYFKPCVII